MISRDVVEYSSGILSALREFVDYLEANPGTLVVGRTHSKKELEEFFTNFLLDRDIKPIPQVIRIYTNWALKIAESRTLSKDVYIASSWKNPIYDVICDAISGWGYSVYDFKKKSNPGMRNIELVWENWDWDKFTDYIRSDFDFTDLFFQDRTAIERCKTCILLLPCGNDAHMELGFAAGKGVPSIIYNHPVTAVQKNLWKPGLMYGFGNKITSSLQELKKFVQYHCNPNYGLQSKKEDREA